MEKRYTVFVSSTFSDLQEQRDEVIKSLMRVKHIPLGMEAFNASNSSSWDVIKKAIDIADYYIVIVGNRYGSIHKTEKISFTEMEYNYASISGVPCLVFIISDESLVRTRDKDNDPELSVKLSEFKKRLADDGRNVIWWSDKGDLTTKVIASLAEEIENSPRPGWTRSLEMSASALEEMTRLSKRNSELEFEINHFRTLGINEPSIDIQIESLNDFGLLYFAVPSIPDAKITIVKSRKTQVETIMNSIEWKTKTPELRETRGFLDALPIIAGIGSSYILEQNRITIVKNFLNQFGLEVSEYDWSFTLTGKTEFGVNRLGIPNTYTKVSGGSDFKKYQLFEEIEEIIESINDEFKSKIESIKKHNIIIKLINNGTLAAKDLNISISFTNTNINIKNIDKNKNKLGLMKNVLSPGESIEITDFYYLMDDSMSYNKGHYEEDVEVKITGSNLSRPITLHIPVQIEVGQ